MSNPFKLRKAGGLFILIVLPVLFFLFLKFFGKNHFALPKYYPLEVSEEGDTTYFRLPQYKLQDQSGKTFSSDQLEGKIVAANFMFTRCPGPCPRMTNLMLRVQQAFEDRDDVKIVSFSVDPQFDNDSVLKQFAERNGAIYGKWYFLTGDKEIVKKLSGPEGYKLALDMGEESPETIDHSSKFVLTDKSGIIRGYYSGTSEEDVDRLILEIKVLLSEYEQ